MQNIVCANELIDMVHKIMFRRNSLKNINCDFLSITTLEYLQYFEYKLETLTDGFNYKDNQPQYIRQEKYKMHF